MSKLEVEEKSRHGQERRRWLGLALLALCTMPAGIGQIAPASQAGTPRPGFGTEPARPGDAPEPDPHRLERFREDDRHKRLQADTARLVQLSRELKEEVDKTPKDELSVDVVRKAAEIEKLAKDVKDRMRS